jgi:RNA polymerase sigma-54 factor
MDISYMQSQQLKQKLCQSQINSLKILAMNNIGLKSFLQTEQLENPLLEIPEISMVEDIYSLSSWFSDNGRTYFNQKDNERENQPDIPERVGPSLFVYLKAQINHNEFLPDEVKLLYYIIDLLDIATGFLTVPVKEIAFLTGAKIESVVKCVKYLQAMEPPGVGAESLKHCLIIQATRAGCADKKLVKLIKYHLEDIAECRYKKIADGLCISREQLIGYIERIKSFNPRPSRGFGDDTAQYIIPDVIMSCHSGEWEIVLNDKWIGSVGINKLYKSYLVNADDENVRKYLKEKINRTKFIMRCIEQRRNTLLKISCFIVEKQLDFITGAGQLKAMSFNDVAEEFKIHSSTVSRTIKDKYIQTPKGIYSFRRFFVGRTSHNSTTDDEVSNIETKTILKKIIHEENKQTPYSDNVLVEELKKYNIILSRRTVAKYRKELRLPSAADRRRI